MSLVTNFENARNVLGWIRVRLFVPAPSEFLLLATALCTRHAPEMCVGESIRGNEDHPENDGAPQDTLEGLAQDLYSDALADYARVFEVAVRLHEAETWPQARELIREIVRMHRVNFVHFSNNRFSALSLGECRAKGLDTRGMTTYNSWSVEVGCARTPSFARVRDLLRAENPDWTPGMERSTMPTSVCIPCHSWSSLLRSQPTPESCHPKPRGPREDVGEP